MGKDRAIFKPLVSPTEKQHHHYLQKVESLIVPSAIKNLCQQKPLCRKLNWGKHFGIILHLLLWVCITCRSTTLALDMRPPNTLSPVDWRHGRTAWSSKTQKQPKRLQNIVEESISIHTVEYFRGMETN